MDAVVPSGRFRRWRRAEKGLQELAPIKNQGVAYLDVAAPVWLLQPFSPARGEPLKCNETAQAFRDELGTGRRKMGSVQRKRQGEVGKLTDDDLMMIKGRRENLTGMLKERYGLEKETAEKEIDAWMQGLQQ